MLIGPGTASAVVSDVQPIDGPSADVVDVADAAMSEDGSGGIVWLKRVGGRAHVFAARFRNGAWGAGAAGRRRPGLRLELAADRRRRRRPPRRHLGAGVRGRERPPLLGDARPRRQRVPVPCADRLQRRRGDLDLSPTWRWPVAARPTSSTGSSPMSAPPTRPATSAPTCVSPATTADSGRCSARRSTATSPTPVRNAERGQRARGRHRRPGPGRGRLAGARRRVRRPGLGTAPVRDQHRDPAPGRVPRAGKERRCAAPPTASRSTSPASVRRRIAFRQQPGRGEQAERAPTDGQRDTRRLRRESGRLRRHPAGRRRGPRRPRRSQRRGRPARPLLRRLRRRRRHPAWRWRRSSPPTRSSGSTRAVARLPATRSSTWPKPAPRSPPGASCAAARASSPCRSGAPTAWSSRPTLSAPRGGAVGRTVMGGSGLGDAIVAWKQGDGGNAQIAAAVVDAPPDPFLVLLPSGWQRKKRITDRLGRRRRTRSAACATRSASTTSR